MTQPFDVDPIARDVGLPREKVRRTIELLEEGNTVPFITRYRKDQTGGLDEEQIRQIQERATLARLLNERKQTILKSIEGQGKLTERLAEEIRAATTIKRLEDLYLPFKPKKLTLATIARERGLEPLAREVLNADPLAADLNRRAADFVNPDKRVASAAEALLGVGHLIAEYFSERAELRAALRKMMLQSGKLISTRIAPPEPPAKPGPVPVAAPASAAEAPEAAVAAQAAAEDTRTEPALPPAEVAATESPAPPAVATDDASGAGSPVEDVPPPAPPTTVPPVEGEGSKPTEPPQTDSPEVAAESAAQTADEAPAESAAAGQAASDAPAAEAVVDAEAFAEVAASAKEKFTPAEVELKRVAATRTRKRKDAKKAKRKEAETSYRDYFDFKESLAKLPPHRVLAINRGEQTNVLRVKIEADVEAMYREAEQMVVPVDHPHAEFLRGCLRDALTRLILPSLEREIRRELTEKAEKHAVEVFARNLRHLLLQPPIHGRRVLAIDPGYRSGCKVAALDEFGNVLGHGMVHLVGNEERRKQSRHRLVEMIRLYHITAVAIGNGAACREAEQLVGDILAEELKDQDVAYVVVNEAGASVYSTSPVGREELPQFDPILRSAVSIGRRLLDPLSELVKINPSNIGVGLYQHDVKAKHLRESLDAVVESCVNYVGVDVNTASPALLRYVSGLNQLTARRLYDYRCQHGPFAHREDLRKVPGIGEATFVQAAGFLKISGGSNPLDATWIHPESYGIAERVLEKLGSSLAELAPPPKPAAAPPPPAEAPAAAEAAAPAEAAPTEGVPAAESPAEPPAGDVPPAVVEASAGSAAAETPAPPAEAAPEVARPLPAAPAPERSATAQVREKLAKQAETLQIESLSQELNVGEHLLRDILTNLTRPGRDPREDLPPPTFRRGIVKLENLAPGMELTGTVLNVVDFGAFCDIGIGDSGLVHISRLADRYIADPHEVVSVGDVLKLWVVSVDKERRRVSLTAIKPGSERSRGPHPRRPERKPAGAEAGGAAGSPGGRPPRGGGRPGGNRPATASGTAESRPGVFGGGRGGGGPGGRSGGGGAGGEGRPRGKGGFGGKGPRPAGPPKTYEAKGKAPPPKPITKAMKEGRAPMRSFSDLAQFYKQDDTQKKAEPPKHDSPPPEPPVAPPQTPEGETPST